ncbi:MAG TPA: DUF4920 domain-containing protein [Pricia antarctica]|uniref:DUF4920 domain-containing protein n=1 Tax=Pricia antarctica TaxID=641691 RepID=A0A831QLP6_9FLAO|nr:DUF4920 domain-containing protein [Pricia antarctica]
MKKFNITLIVLLFVFLGSAQDKKETSIESSLNSTGYSGFGKEINADDAISTTELSKAYENLHPSDSLPTKFRATVTDVCKAKGCWMKLKLEDGTEAMVRFKDYGFFMPKDIIGREVVVNGQAFVEEMTVDDQIHYAKDGGSSEADIATITSPKKTYGFEADGVLLLNP